MTAKSAALEHRFAFFIEGPHAFQPVGGRHHAIVRFEFKHVGAVAAPTAGLHFSKIVMKKMELKDRMN